MSHQVCTTVSTWADPVLQQVETCLEQPCNWWCLCCNKWLCALAWVVITVGTWVVNTTCELIADTVDVVAGSVTGLIDLIAGILTGDWSRALAGLIRIVGEPVKFALDVLSIATARHSCRRF